jgi:hypothetical protein
MYLIINGNRHDVSRRIVSNDTIKFLTVTPEPEEVSGKIRMFENNGFLISEDNADDFSRWAYSGTLLTLTNAPERVPSIAPVQTEVTTADIAAAIVEGVNEV